MMPFVKLYWANWFPSTHSERRQSLLSCVTKGTSKEDAQVFILLLFAQWAQLHPLKERSGGGQSRDKWLVLIYSRGWSQNKVNASCAVPGSVRVETCAAEGSLALVYSSSSSSPNILDLFRSAWTWGLYL